MTKEQELGRLGFADRATRASTEPASGLGPDGRVSTDASRCERCAVLEDLLETATSERDKARDESRKADDETLALKVRDVSKLASDMTGSYAAIKAFQRRAEEAEELSAELLKALRAMILNDTHTYRDCHKAALAAVAKATGAA